MRGSVRFYQADIRLYRHDSCIKQDNSLEYHKTKLIDVLLIRERDDLFVFVKEDIR